MRGLCYLILIVLIACQSNEESKPILIDPPPESRTVNLDLEGLPWIFELEQTPEFPGYRGFYLGKDGRLLLINFPDAIGDKWEIQGDLLSLSFLQGAAVPMDAPHSFHVIVDSVEDGLPMHIRLIPAYNHSAKEIPLIRGSAEIDLVENYWLLKALVGSEDLQWPIDTDVHMILLPGKNGLGILGHGGVNLFSGGVEIGDETFKVGLLASTLMAGPHLDFEDRYTSGLMNVNRYVQVDFNLFLYSDTTPIAAFQAQMFN